MNRLLPCIFGCILLFATSIANGATTLPNSWSTELQISTTRLITATGDSANVMAMTTNMHKARFSDQQIIGAQGIINEAIQKGIPATPLFNKAREGIVKHVSATTIVKAMQQVRLRYGSAQRTAATLSDEPQRQEELTTILFGAQSAGMSQADLEKITLQLQVQSENQHQQRWNMLVNDSLVTSRDMARHGVNSDLISGIITGLLAKGADGSEITSTSRAMNSWNNRLSLNERARVCLSIISSEQSVANIMQQIQQRKGPGKSSGGSAFGAESIAGSDKGNSGKNSDGNDSGKSGANSTGSSDNSGGSSSPGGSAGSGNAGDSAGSSGKR